MRTQVKPKTFIIISVLVLFFGISGSAQRTRTVSGESQIKVEPHLSRIETEEKAIENAKIDAITKVFGEYIEQESTMGLESGKIDFRSYGQTKVKGEWVRTIGIPEFNDMVRHENGRSEIWISCKIKGEVRKAIPKANVQVDVLSCPQKNCRTDEFVNDQNMYLHVKSPVDGYLSIFLDDGTSVYRLLPYRRMGAMKSVRIEGDQEYILFSREIENFDTPADRIELFTNKDHESNTIVIVFAENEFQKPLLFNEQTDQAGFITPKSLSKNDFENWLGDQRAIFPDFLDLKKKIVIEKE